MPKINATREELIKSVKDGEINLRHFMIALSGVERGTYINERGTEAQVDEIIRNYNDDCDLAWAVLDTLYKMQKYNNPS